MATYVPGFKHDIFISYAHVDDETLPGIDTGWVTNLVRCLKTCLAQQLGRSDAYELWMDYELSKHVKVTPQITSALRETAILVIVLSPGYVASEWCEKEMTTFLERMKEEGGSRLFIVERDIVDAGERPPEFNELIGFRFWESASEGKSKKILGWPQPKPNDRYYEVVRDLAIQLEKELKSLKSTAASSPDLEKSDGSSGHPARSDRQAVFLAQVTDDLDPKRENVKRYLNQADFDVLPEWYTLDTNKFKEAVERDMSRCELFVQLLSNVAGKKPPSLRQGYVQLQLEIAQSLNKPILQWRSPSLDVEKVEDKDHRELLEADTVRAEGIEDLKREIRKRLVEKPVSLSKRYDTTFVFVNMESADRPLADKVCDALYKRGVNFILPVDSDDPKVKREDLEMNLRYCSGSIIIYGSSTVNWVRQQVLESLGSLGKREKPLNAFAIYDGPPEEKCCLGMELPGVNLKVFNFRKAFNESELQLFINSLRQENHS